jgi:hypothetical protein
MDQIFSWQGVALILGGVVGAKIIGFIADWLNGKGAEFVHEKLENLQTKLNENSILSQISADDAVIDILEQAIPDVLHEATDDVRAALADGKIDSVEWKDIGAKLWAKSKDHIQGGANDYLKSSSFADGAAIAAIVAQRFFKKQKAQKDGLIVEAPRAETK